MKLGEMQENCSNNGLAAASNRRSDSQAIKFSPQAARHGILSLGKIASFLRAPAGLSRGVEK